MPGKTGKKKKIASPEAWIFFAVILLDRLTKALVLQRLRESESFPVVEGFFHLTRVNNTGAAFGILKHSQAVLIAVSLLFIFTVGVWFARAGRRPAAVFSAWALVLAGAAGNLYDRIRYGYVIDFLDFRIWPVFNVADAGISCGVLWLGVHFLSKGKGF